MFRFLPVAVVLVAGQALARPDNSVEAQRVVEGLLDGSVGSNQALNRIQFLGQERYATAEILFALKRITDRKKRETLIDVLASLGVRDSDVEKLFLQALSSTETGEAMAGARGLGKLRSENGLGPLIKALAHPILGVRREAARALGEIGRPAAGGPLFKAATAETDLDVKVLMLAAVGKSGDKKQAGPLEALLKDSSESTRMAAARGLCSLGTPSCATFAGKLLASADRNERFSGVMLFEGAPVKSSGPSLTKMLEDKDLKVRARAARLLVEAGDSSKLGWLVIESAKATGEARLPYEDELERLRLTDEQRQAILKKAGLQ